MIFKVSFFQETGHRSFRFRKICPSQTSVRLSKQKQKPGDLEHKSPLAFQSPSKAQPLPGTGTTPFVRGGG